MRKFISERALVIILFIAAFLVFSLAQEETRKQEKLHLDSNASASPRLIPAPQPNASLVTEEITTPPNQLR